MGSEKSQGGYSVPNNGNGAAWYDDNPNGYDHSEEPGPPRQSMRQIRRSAEASKQMLYGVFGNVVAILEEYEARMQKMKAARSNIALPDQSGKTDEDVQIIVQSQLMVFEKLQMTSPAEVSKSVNKELRNKTILWTAVRAEQKMPHSVIDSYICKLYEVLAKGETTHEFLDEPMEPVSAKTIRENVQHMLKGKQDATELDKRFKNDEKKKATSPDTRRPEEALAFQNGAARMGQILDVLKPYLDQDVRRFNKGGVTDFK